MSYGPGKEFEWTVALTLEAAGYKITQFPLPSCDDGVDIKYEIRPLAGLKSIGLEGFVQCKESKIGRPDVDQLYGALNRKNSPFGLLVTKGVASPDAKECLKSLETRVKLIEGDEWSELEKQRQKNMLLRKFIGKSQFRGF